MQELSHSIRTLPAKMERMNLKEKWKGVSGFLRKNKDALKQKASGLHQKLSNKPPAEQYQDLAEEDEEEFKTIGEPILPEAQELKKQTDE